MSVRRVALASALMSLAAAPAHAGDDQGGFPKLVEDLHTQGLKAGSSRT
jgi:hypothetical protein